MVSIACLLMATSSSVVLVVVVVYIKMFMYDDF